MRSSRFCLAALLLVAAGCGSEDQNFRPGADPRYDQIQQAATVCAGSTTLEGIDVSKWQGSVDWSQVKASGRVFGIARISYGVNTHDAYFQQNWDAIKANGLIRGAYQYYVASQDPAAQADVVINAVGRLGPGDLPVTVDVEDPDASLSAAAYRAALHTWLDRVEQGTGKRPIIYTGKYYWDDHVNSGEFASYPLWHAQYTNASCPNISDHWSNWTIWQYRASATGGVPAGSCPGVSGDVDVDKFNGTMDDLNALAGVVTNKPPRGYLDSAGFDHVSGWAQDPDTPDQSIAVHLYLNGPVGSANATGIPITADQHRDDLCSAIGSCNHGFSWKPTSQFCDGQPHEVHAYGIDSAGGANPELSSSPQTFTCHPPAGSLDSADCNGIGGWSYDADEPDTAIAVHIYLDGPAGNENAKSFPITADQRRDDLCTSISSCNHGFSWTLPESYRDGKPHELHAYGIDTSGIANAELGNSPKTITCAPSESPDAGPEDPEDADTEDSATGKDGGTHKADSGTQIKWAASDPSGCACGITASKANPWAWSLALMLGLGLAWRRRR